MSSGPTRTYACVRLIAAGAADVVGDDDQSIYGWRGRRSRIFTKLPARLPSSELIPGAGITLTGVLSRCQCADHQTGGDGKELGRMAKRRAHCALAGSIEQYFERALSSSALISGPAVLNRSEMPFFTSNASTGLRKRCCVLPVLRTMAGRAFSACPGNQNGMAFALVGNVGAMCAGAHINADRGIGDKHRKPASALPASRTFRCGGRCDLSDTGFAWPGSDAVAGLLQLIEEFTLRSRGVPLSHGPQVMA